MVRSEGWQCMVQAGGQGHARCTGSMDVCAMYAAEAQAACMYVLCKQQRHVL